jgi:hypothetical protein
LAIASQVGIGAGAQAGGGNSSDKANQVKHLQEQGLAVAFAVMVSRCARIGSADGGLRWE